jgi:F-type H+-transporting ATPase subunit b
MMEINATLLGQMITFILFVLFTMKFVWPPIKKAMLERQKNIAEGLQAAEQGRRELELAQRKFKKVIDDAKLEASHILERANERAVQVVEEAKEFARQESQRLLAQANVAIEQDIQNARSVLRQEVASLVIKGAEQILRQEVNSVTHHQLLEELASSL